MRMGWGKSFIVVVDPLFQKAWTQSMRIRTLKGSFRKLVVVGGKCRTDWGREKGV